MIFCFHSERETALPPVIEHKSSNDVSMQSGTRVFRVKMKDKEVVGISVDLRINVWGDGDTTVVLDLVSTVGNVTPTPESRTDDPPTTLYLPISRLWGDWLVDAVVDTTKAVLHARSHLSVSSGTPYGLLNVATSAQVEQTAHTTDGLDPTRIYYAVVHYSRKFTIALNFQALQCMLITSCVWCVIFSSLD